MNFLKKLFGKKEKEKPIVSFTLNLFGKEQEYVIDVSNEAKKKRTERYVELEQTAWQGKNEIEKIRDDGVVIYKLNRVTTAEREQIGFYGLKWFSENNKYCVVFLVHNNEQHNIGLINTENKTVLYKSKLQRPHRCRVSNEGIVVCEDWKGYDSPACAIYVLDINGNIIIEKRHNTGIGDVFEFIDNETRFKYNINSTGKIHTINLNDLK